MFGDRKINENKSELEYSEDLSGVTVKIENENGDEQESYLERSLPRFSYTLDLSFHQNKTEGVSREVKNVVPNVKPTLEYVKVKSDNSVVTNSYSPWALASKTIPRSLERILHKCGVQTPKNARNVIIPETNIRKKSSIENKDVNLKKDEKINKLRDQFISERNSQFAIDFTSESDVLKEYKEKTRSVTDIQTSQNKFGESEDDMEKNVGCLSEENVEEDISGRKKKNKRKQDKPEETSTLETLKVQLYQKKKNHQQLEDCFINSDIIEFDHLAENGVTENIKTKEEHVQNFAKMLKKKKYRHCEDNKIMLEKRKKKKENKQPEESISYVGKNQFVQLNDECECPTQKIKKKKLEEKIIYIDDDQFVHMPEDYENFAKTLKKNKYKLHEQNEIVIEKIKKKKENKQSDESISYVGKNKLNEDSECHAGKTKKKKQSEGKITCIDNNQFVNSVDVNENLTKKIKKKKHEGYVEENISSIDSSECIDLVEENESLTDESKIEKYGQFELSRSSIYSNNSVDLVEENKSIAEKSKKKNHDQFEHKRSDIEVNKLLHLNEENVQENKSFIHKIKKKKNLKQFEESISDINKNELMGLTGKYISDTKVFNSISEKEKRKRKTCDEIKKNGDNVNIDTDRMIQLNEESECPTRKIKKKKLEEKINHIDDDQFIHMAEDDEYFAEKLKKKNYNSHEENEIVIKKCKKKKKDKQREESISYVGKNQFVQLNKETESPTRKIKKKKLEEKITYIDDNQFVHMAEDDENFAKKLKKNKYKLHEENEIVIEKHKKKKENKQTDESISYVSKNQFVQLNEDSECHVGKTKKKKHIEPDEKITYIDNNQFVHLVDENESFTKKNKKKKHVAQNIENSEFVDLVEENESLTDDSKIEKFGQFELNRSGIYSNNFVDLIEHNESVTEKNKKKKPGKLEQNRCSIYGTELVDLVEENESIAEKSKKEKHDEFEQMISDIDNDELLHLNGENVQENESVIHKNKKKKNLKQLEESISEYISDTKVFNSISERKKRKRKTFDEFKKNGDKVNIDIDRMIDDEEDIFSGISISEASREKIIEKNVENKNSPPLSKKINNFSGNKSLIIKRERENSFVIKEELPNNLAKNVDKWNMKNVPQDVVESELDNNKPESYTFSDILSQKHSDKLMQMFNDIVNKSNTEKSCSDLTNKNYVSKSQLKQRTLHDFVKPNINLEEHQKKLKIIDMLNASKSIENIKEELEMPDIMEQRKQVEGLVIETDWPIAPIHRIAYFVNSCPSAEQKRALQSAGITWKLGKYTKEEDEKIIQNWANFCKIHNWKEENYQPFLKCSTKSDIGILNKQQYRKFAHFLSRGFENRLMYSVYHRFQRLFSENEANTGRFTEEDDRIIKEYVSNGNSNQPFAELVDLLKRSRLALIKRYRFIKTQNNIKEERVLWDKELTECLLANLIEVTRSVNLSELKDHNITIQEWKKVSSIMNISLDKLKRAWSLSLYPRFFSENYVAELTEVKKELVDLLYIKYNDWREVNWNEVAEELDNKFSAAKLCKVMRDLVISKVPPKKRNNLHKALKYVRIYYQDWGKTRDRFKFVEEILKETENGTIIPKIVKKNAHDVDKRSLLNVKSPAESEMSDFDF